ncbi:hypothetical protein K1718_18615 [Roseibium porphyridii]|uniref:Uncharacterized protein n=1 Tax=Roseibium porphyridii TaxID=2866279 RepID=A0ABY8EYI3_9HYPH|nr:hypothetical protein [Roseibium sp. KMA01]WFE88168.1 hypothetical protein K1718_18615 [Roseibium sp. KMA01]
MKTSRSSGHITTQRRLECAQKMSATLNGVSLHLLCTTKGPGQRTT